MKRLKISFVYTNKQYLSSLLLLLLLLFIYYFLIIIIIIIFFFVSDLSVLPIRLCFYVNVTVLSTQV